METEHISDDEKAYLEELSKDVEYASRKLQDYGNYLFKRYGITGMARLMPDGTIVRPGQPAAPVEAVTAEDAPIARNGLVDEPVPAEVA